jgi:hypothetical protein
MPEPVCMKFCMNIMAAWVHLNDVLHKSLQSVCVSICLSLFSLQSNGSVKFIHPFGARQRLGKHVPAATNTCNNRKIVGRVCLWVYLCIPLRLLGNNSVKKFPRQRRIVRRQRRIVWGVVFCTVRVVSKESRQLVLPRTYYLCIYNSVSLAHIVKFISSL